MIKDIIEGFINPAPVTHGAPFWAWNGKLEEDTLRSQIRDMKEMGFGGFFMHSRTGLDTAYLGDDWFKAIDICIDEAEKQNMLAYLYDEDRWPSGAAGGFVTSDDRFKMQKLYCSPDDVPSDGQWLVSFAITLNGRKISSMRRIAENAPLQNGEKKFNFFSKLMPSSSWYNHACSR